MSPKLPFLNQRCLTTEMARIIAMLSQKPRSLSGISHPRYRYVGSAHLGRNQTRKSYEASSVGFRSDSCDHQSSSLGPDLESRTLSRTGKCLRFAVALVRVL